ncbi:MAG: uracil-DNA glycosylase [bacterium]|nr:uracil-DNA glycosylase [bacterium]
MGYLAKLYLESIGVRHLPSRGPAGVVLQPEVGGEVQPGDDLALDGLRRDLGDCRRCGLAAERNNIVFGVGDPGARVVFVGEAPGRDEDLRGEPFVGKAGQTLTRIIAAMGLTREQVYICNVIKCRPPGNRDPLPAEVAMCQPFLARQLEIIQPQVICALGSFAARTLLGSDLGISRLRGDFHDYKGTPLMPTYHPSYLLRNPHAKRDVWEDIQKVMELLGLPLPTTGRS